MAKQNRVSTQRPGPKNPAQTKKEANRDGANVPSSNEAIQSDTAPRRRNLTGLKSIFTDLYKLCVAKVIKYEGWEDGKEYPDTHPEKFSTWEHTHPFRTFDKKGDRMTTCTPIGGHFHVVEWEQSEHEDAPPVIKSVSGPMVMQRQNIRGKNLMVPVPSNDFDDHVHEWEYIRSAKIEVSTTNFEAAAVIAQMEQKTAALPGVTER